MDRVLQEESVISFISEIEIQAWNPPNPEDLKIYSTFVEHSDILRIDRDIIRETIEIRKWIKVKLPDALIAATAIVNNRTLADNDKDFKRIPNLKYINPNRDH